MSQIRVLLLLCAFSMVNYMLVMAVKPHWHRYSSDSSSSFRYTDMIKQYVNMSLFRCVYTCDRTQSCNSANYNSDTGTCELTQHVPHTLALQPTDEPNWNVYYCDKFILGIAAWQVSTYNYYGRLLTADLAIDGNRLDDIHGTSYCAHTNKENNSAWAMELERPAEVAVVIIYFRSVQKLNYRNTNLRLLVSTTRANSDENIGTECAVYGGPPDVPAEPVTITCSEPVYGRFLKIIQMYTEYLTLCEVEVYST